MNRQTKKQTESRTKNGKTCRHTGGKTNRHRQTDINLLYIISIYNLAIIPMGKKDIKLLESAPATVTVQLCPVFSM
jgi:hypothetical protein